MTTPSPTPAAAATGPGGMSGRAAVAAVARGETTAAELLAEARRRAEQWEPWLRAVVEYVDDGAPAEGPLNGLVAGIKDIISVAGMTRGCGAPEAVQAAREPDAAPVVAALRGRGTSLLATLELHPLAFGVITPQTRNPRAPERIAGGSSGGAAAALAAGSIHVALGTDTGGSVRGPASCCGVVGLKTTRGLLPLTGVQALAWSLDTVGPMAAAVDDVELVLPYLTGHDPADPVSVEDPPLLPPVDGPLRVGVPSQLDTVPIDPEVRSAWTEALDALDGAGHAVTRVDLPLLPEAPPANGLVLCAEAVAVHRELLERRPAAVPAMTQERFSWGAGLLAADVADARRLGTLLAAQLRVALSEVDVLCTPTVACRVPRRGEEVITVDGVEQPTTLAMTKFTNPWNLIGCPAGTVPAGADSGGGPIGVQIVGPWWGERIVLQGMREVERLSGGPWAPAAVPSDTVD